MNLTPWFPGNVRPKRRGVYKTWDKGLRQSFYNYWDGKKWNGGWGTAEDAARFGDRRCDDPVDKWRGLAKPDGAARE